MLMSSSYLSNDVLRLVGLWLDQRSLEKTGDRLVVFMNENEQFRVNHRFCRPFIGTSQDDIMRRVSRGNKRMARAIKVWNYCPFFSLVERLSCCRDPLHLLFVIRHRFVIRVQGLRGCYH